MKILDELNARYARLHTAKEDAFWTAKMGLDADTTRAQTDCDAKENELQRFLQDPAQLASVERALSGLPANATDDERLALHGWRATFAAHSIASSDARALAETVVVREGELAQARAALETSYVDEKGQRQRASSVMLSGLLRSSPHESVRRSAFDALRTIERHVLAHGFLDVIGLRNQLGRMEGAEDYYDWKTKRVEGSSKREVFELLDDLERRTRDGARRAVEALASTHGATALRPWNLFFVTQGDSTRELDPFFPFADAVRRWGRSFANLGIDYRGAALVLDLVDRPGKYENGFMHGPVVAWRDRGRHIPARIHFTANALPNQVGSGFRATETLFHEGGHAAHFANIDMPAPCFGQEFAPTSVGFSETQSMFLDSLLHDADWQRLYARGPGGAELPWELIERAIECQQPLAAWQARAMLAVCYAERALYELDDDHRTPERALELVRRIEREMLFIPDGAPRPVLAVPHLLAGESSAYYHGYVLAEMAVETTRDHFLARDGRIADNSRVGPELARAYWQPGNSLSFLEFIPRLTGKRLGAESLARRLCAGVGDRVASARESLRRLSPRTSRQVGLNARIRLVHGTHTIAESDGDFERFASACETWIRSLRDAGSGPAEPDSAPA